MPITRRRFIQTGTAAAAGLSLWGCGNGQVPAGSNAPASATTVFRNGIVLPVDAGFSQHAALASRDGRILAVGDNDAVAETAGRGANVVDLDGRVVLPGFIEPHMHFLLMAGLGHLRDIGPFNYPTFEETLAALREIRVEALAAGPDEWVMGRQFDPILLEPQRELLAADLDEVGPDTSPTSTASPCSSLALPPIRPTRMARSSVAIPTGRRTVSCTGQPHTSR